MIKTILVFFTIIFTLPVFSQNSFPDSNAIWNVNIGNTGKTILYGLKGDTLINDTLYDKVYLLSDTSLDNKNLKEYLGGFRKDGSKVFFKPRFWEFENLLLYDFDMQIGDTISYNATLIINNIGEHNFEHLSVNRFLVLNSIDTNEFGIKRFNLWGYKYEECLLGMGSTTGLFGPINQIFLPGPFYYLSCFKQDDTVRYKGNHECSTCFCDKSSLIEVHNGEVNTIFVYNDFHQKSLTVEIKEPFSHGNVEIYDENGKIIYNREFQENNLQIKLEFNGIYFIKFFLDKKIITKKVII